MNGVHDMGGMQGFGQVIREENEPVFHEEWEGKMRAMVVCLSRNNIVNLDEVRYAVERVRPDYYLAFTYYEKWLYGLLILLIEKGVLSDHDIQELKRILSIDEDRELLDALTQLKYAPNKKTTEILTHELSPKFKPGDQIKTKLVHQKGHTRLPGYAKGRMGIIKEIQGSYKLPETNIYSGQAMEEPVYLVEFDASELWGPDVPRKDKVLIDLWESYLESAAV